MAIKTAEMAEARVLARAVAGATVLQLVPSLHDDALARAAVQIAHTLVQAGARAF